jgi:hypothetical protein
MSNLAPAPTKTPIDGSILLNRTWMRWYSDLYEYIKGLSPTPGTGHYDHLYEYTAGHGITVENDITVPGITADYLVLTPIASAPAHNDGKIEIYALSADPKIIYAQRDGGTTKLTESETDMTGF